MSPTNLRPTVKEDLTRLKRLAKIAAAVGTILALVCHFIPPHYRAVCNAVAALCTGG